VGNIGVVIHIQNADEFRFIVSGKKSFLAISLIIAVMILFVDEFAFSVKALTVSALDQIQSISWMLYAGFSLSVIVDIIIAVLLSYFLLLKSRNGFKSTNSLIRTLTLYTINTGLLVSIVSVCVLTTYATMPHNFIFFAFFIPLSKLFVNSFLATLNARASLRLREGPSRREFGSISLSKLSGSSTSNGTGSTSGTIINLENSDPHYSAPKIGDRQIQKEIYLKGEGTSSIEIDTKGMPLEESV